MTKWLKYKNFIAIAAMAMLFALVAYGIHDMQTAQGVGLFFALKFGGGRLPYDIATDVIVLLGFAGVTILAPIVLEHRKLFSFFRFYCLFLAFMPVLSISYLLKPILYVRDYSFETEIFCLQTLVPMAVILTAVVSYKEKLWKKIYGTILFSEVICIALPFFFPWIQPLGSFLAVYFLLWLNYDLYERVIDLWPEIKVWEWILYGGLIIRAVYNILVLTGKY